MTIAKVLGYNDIKAYTSKSTGETYDCVSVALGFELPSWHGTDVERAFLRVMKDSPIFCYDWLEIGTQVYVEYNRWGKIDGLRPVELDS